MLLALSLLACQPPDDIDRCGEAPQGAVSLPGDEARHDEQMEWYYWTGHLQDDQGRWYGFEQVYFFFDFGVYQSQSAHLAISDIAGGLFDFDVAYIEELPESDALDFDVEGHTAAGAEGEEHLSASVGDYAWSLDLSAVKPAVLQHGDGYHEYDEGGYTYYYSRERIDVSGSLEVVGEARAVTGSAWFDHQWGDLYSISDAGWDWFALQLDDGREIMLFLVAGSAELVGGSYSDERCQMVELGEGDFTLEPAGEWISPHTGCTYPSGWTLEVAGLSLTITPALADQELYNDYNTYWEGAATVSGDVTGRAYVELAGQCN